MFWLVTITKNSWATYPPEFWLPIGIIFPKNIMNILRLLHIACLFCVFYSHFNSVQDRCECGRELEYNLQRERERIDSIHWQWQESVWWKTSCQHLLTIHTANIQNSKMYTFLLSYAMNRYTVLVLRRKGTKKVQRLICNRWRSIF